MHQKEQSVEQDVVKSLEWVRRAVEQGYQSGQHLLHKFRNDNYFSPTAQHEKTFNSDPSSLGVIKAVVEDLLQQINDRMLSDGQLQYERLRTAHSDGAIRVTIPDVVFELPNFGRFQLGDMGIQVRRENARYDSIYLNLPSEVRFCTPNGTQGRISITNSLAKVRWDNHLQISSEFDFSLRNLVFSLNQGSVILRIGQFLAKSDVEKTQGLWSGPLHLNARDVTLGNCNRENFKLASARMILDMRDLDMSSYATKAKMGPTKNQGFASGLDPWKHFLTLVSSAQLQTAITGLRIQDTVRDPLQLAKAQFDIDLTTSDRQVLNVTLDTHYEGLYEIGATKADDILPRKLDLTFSLGNLPVNSVVDGVTALVEVALLGRMNADSKVLERLRQDLAAAGTVLLLKSAKVTAHKFDFDLTLQVFAEMAAKSGFIGDGVLRIRGLKKIMTKLGLQDLPPVAGLIKNEQLNVSSECTSFDIAVRPDGMLTVNSCPVLSLASI